MLESIAKVKTRVREAAADAPAKGLDWAVAQIEEALASAWLLERRGDVAPKAVPEAVFSVEAALRKLAPPPPKKVKFSAPLRRILPLSEANVRAGLDAAMLLQALVQVGDFSDQTDKARHGHELFLDDWRRMLWESAKIADWGQFRRLATTEERVLEGRLSRDAALQVLEAFARHRADQIGTIPDLSMLACARCGQFRGSRRVRCLTCRGTYCTRCMARTTGLCLADYAARYAPLEADLRKRVAADAVKLMDVYKLSEHARNEVFVQALREEGVEVVFQETAPLEGIESEESQGRRRLAMRDREGPAAKRALFGALARCYFRVAGIPAEPLVEDYFVDICLGLPVGP